MRTCINSSQPFRAGLTNFIFPFLFRMSRYSWFSILMCMRQKKEKKKKWKSHTILKWSSMKNSFGLLVLGLTAFVFHGPYSVMISFWKSFQMQSKWKLFCSKKNIQLVSVYCKESGLFFICLLLLPLSFLKKTPKQQKTNQPKACLFLAHFYYRLRDGI